MCPVVDANALLGAMQAASKPNKFLPERKRFKEYAGSDVAPAGA